MTAPLWTCPTCQLIGSHDEALAHTDETGHIVEGLTPVESIVVERVRGYEPFGPLTMIFRRARERAA